MSAESLFQREDREVVVSVELRFPFAEVVEAYAHALTPDGGLPESVTLNAYLKDYAEGVAEDMAKSIPHATSTSSWRLTDGS